MNICITCVFSISLIPLLILAKETQVNSTPKDKYYAVNQRNATNTNLKTSHVSSDFQEYGVLDPKFAFNRSHNEVRKRRSKKKRQFARLAKTPQHVRSSLSRQAKHKKNVQQNEDVKTYETFEEIHEHVNEPDSQEGQYLSSERYENHEETGAKLENNVKEREDVPLKIKVKHHHHHHHHNHIKEVIKSVPKPYPVEKIVHIPIEKIVEKIVHVPKFVNVTVEKIIHVPVEKIIEKVVRIPKPVHIPKPYVIEKIMEKIVHVPKPYPVLKTVPYPVEIKVPIPVEKKIPIPFTVEVERKVPVYINSHEPYKYEKKHFKSYEEDMAKYNSDIEETSNRPVFSSENFNFNSLNPHKQTEYPRKTDFQTIDEATMQHTNIGDSKPFAPIEQSAAESTFLPLKFVETKPAFNILVANNDTSLDLNPQALGNKLNEFPFSFPIEFIQIHPMPFQNPLRLEPSNSESSLKST